MVLSIEQLATELKATPAEIRNCAWELRRGSGFQQPRFVTDELAALIRAHLPTFRGKAEHRRRAASERLDRQLTTKEVADELGLKPGAIRQWQTRGHLHAVGKLGRQSLYRFGDVVEVRNALSQRATAPATMPWQTERLLESYADRGVTTKQAAGLIGINPSTIRMWVKRGHLKPVGRHGRQLLFVVRDVAAAAHRHP